MATVADEASRGGGFADGSAGHIDWRYAEHQAIIERNAEREMDYGR